MKLSLLALAAAVAPGLLACRAPEEVAPTGTLRSPAGVAFPADYRASFQLYLELDRTSRPDEVQRLFANEVALRGPGPDGKLPYGSILVAEVYAARRDGAGAVRTSGLGRRLRGELVLIDVMERREGFGLDLPPELSNGQWEFAAFTPDGTWAAKDLDDCRSCHAERPDLDHVFSIEHLER